MFTWFDYLVERERRRDELARAEEWRLLEHVLRDGQSQPRVRPRRHEIFLFSLGVRLVRWGRRLQAYRHITASTEGVRRDPLVMSWRVGQGPPPLTAMARGHRPGPETRWRPAGNGRPGAVSRPHFPRDR
jgi:hypothetical protein